MSRLLQYFALGAIFASFSLAQESLQPYYQNRDFQLTGIAASRDHRFFVNFPRWSDHYRYAIVEVLTNGTERPFPNAEWNEWNNKPATAATHFVCVQSVVIDANNSLWVVDAAAPLLATPVPSGPKLVKIDLATNQVTQVIPVGPDVALPDSYLNDIRIDTVRNFAYLTDSGHGGLITVDLSTGKSWRKLDGHPSVLADPNLAVTINGKPVLMANGQPAQFNSDSLELSKDGATVFYKPINSKTLWSVPTSILRDPAASAASALQAVSSNLFPTDGIWLDSKGRIYLSDIGGQAVRRLLPNGTLQTLVQTPRLQWPDTFTEDADGNVYISISRINQQPMFNNGLSERSGQPFEVFRIPGADGP